MIILFSSLQQKCKIKEKNTVKAFICQKCIKNDYFQEKEILEIFCSYTKTRLKIRWQKMPPKMIPLKNCNMRLTWTKTAAFPALNCHGLYTDLMTKSSESLGAFESWWIRSRRAEDKVWLDESLANGSDAEITGVGTKSTIQICVSL